MKFVTRKVLSKAKDCIKCRVFYKAQGIIFYARFEALSDEVLSNEVLSNALLSNALLPNVVSQMNLYHCTSPMHFSMYSTRVTTDLHQIYQISSIKCKFIIMQISRKEACQYPHGNHGKSPSHHDTERQSNKQYREKTATSRTLQAPRRPTTTRSRPSRS